MLPEAHSQSTTPETPSTHPTDTWHHPLFRCCPSARNPVASHCCLHSCLSDPWCVQISSNTCWPFGHHLIRTIFSSPFPFFYCAACLSLSNWQKTFLYSKKQSLSSCKHHRCHLPVCALLTWAVKFFIEQIYLTLI